MFLFVWKGNEDDNLRFKEDIMIMASFRQSFDEFVVLIIILVDVAF